MEQKQWQKYLESASVIVAEIQLLSLAKWVGKVKEIWHLAQESTRMLLRLRCQAQAQAQQPANSNPPAGKKQTGFRLQKIIVITVRSSQ